MPKTSFKQYYNKLKSNGTFGNSLIIQLSSEYQVALENVSQRIQDLKVFVHNNKKIKHNRVLSNIFVFLIVFIIQKKGILVKKFCFGG